MLSVFACVASFQHANGEKQAASAWISVFQLQSDSGTTLLFEQQSTHVQVMRTQQHVRTYSQPQATEDAHNTPILCVYTAAQPTRNDDNAGSASGLCSEACAALRNKVA